MMRFAKGNLLEADVQALVNTVNTVGVMGKGIALMFKEIFMANFKEYAAACKRKEVEVGKMFVTERSALTGPRWIINFPTKEHWRGRTRVEWIESGLVDLRRVIHEFDIKSVALPPLGCGNGGLDWSDIRPLIEQALSALQDVDVLVFEPTERYQNVAKKTGVEKLTPARALVAELIRRYWILGIECTILEIQKLAWLLEREIVMAGLDNPLNLRFQADRYGPYAPRLGYLLNGLDGSYLRSDVRIADAKPTDVIAFNDARRDRVATYLSSEASDYVEPLERVSDLIDGFESPLGMELLGTVDWLLYKENCGPEVSLLREGLTNWPGDQSARDRKLRLFNDRLLELALRRLVPS